MSPFERRILELLRQRGRLNGRELRLALGCWGYGRLYVTSRYLAEKGLVRLHYIEERDDLDGSGLWFTLTPAGVAALGAPPPCPDGSWLAFVGFCLLAAVVVVAAIALQ